MQSADEPNSVSAAELVRSFAVCRERASKAPLFITNHGRSTHVLIDAGQFNSLIALQDSTSTKSQVDHIRELADWMDDAVIVTDRDLSILFANRVAHAICHRPAGSMMDKGLIAALPELSGSLLEVHARRTQVSSEPSSADVPSPFSKEAWLRFHTFPIGDMVVMIFRDISEEVSRHRLADVKEALFQAMDTHGVGYVRVSLRGTIDRVDQPFCKLIGLPEDRLMHLPIVDLATVSCRPQFREAIEVAVRGGPPQRTETTLLSNTDGATDVIITLSSLRGAYGAEGAVLLVTRKNAGNAVSDGSASATITKIA